MDGGLIRLDPLFGSGRLDKFSWYLAATFATETAQAVHEMCGILAAQGHRVDAFANDSDKMDPRILKLIRKSGKFVIHSRIVLLFHFRIVLLFTHSNILRLLLPSSQNTWWDFCSNRFMSDGRYSEGRGARNYTYTVVIPDARSQRQERLIQIAKQIKEAPLSDAVQTISFWICSNTNYKYKYHVDYKRLSRILEKYCRQNLWVIANHFM